MMSKKVMTDELLDVLDYLGNVRDRLDGDGVLRSLLLISWDDDYLRIVGDKDDPLDDAFEGLHEALTAIENAKDAIDDALDMITEEKNDG